MLFSRYRIHFILSHCHQSLRCILPSGYTRIQFLFPPIPAPYGGIPASSSHQGFHHSKKILQVARAWARTCATAAYAADPCALSTHVTRTPGASPTILKRFASITKFSTSHPHSPRNTLTHSPLPLYPTRRENVLFLLFSHVYTRLSARSAFPGAKKNFCPSRTRTTPRSTRG